MLTASNYDTVACARPGRHGVDVQSLGDKLTRNLGVVSGGVGCVDGLGVLLPPVLWGAVLVPTRIRSSCFMLLYGVKWMSLILMYFTEVAKVHLVEHVA